MNTTTKGLALAMLLGLAPFTFAEEQAAPVAKASGLPAVNRLVYLPELPTPARLQQEATAQGTTIQRIERTDDSVVVIYKHADGSSEAVGYTTLSPASTKEEPAVVAAPPPPAPKVTVISEPPTRIIYRTRAPVYYETRYYYDPFDRFWAPFTLGIGIGWITGGHGTFYHHHMGHRIIRGGFPYHRGAYHGGGWRR